MDNVLNVKENFFWYRVTEDLNLSHSRREHSDTDILCMGSAVQPLRHTAKHFSTPPGSILRRHNSPHRAITPHKERQEQTRKRCRRHVRCSSTSIALWYLRWIGIFSLSSCPSAPTFPHLGTQLFLDFRAICFWAIRQVYVQGWYRDSPRLLGESWWPKNEGPFGEKNAQKSRNSCSINSRSCGCIGTVESGSKCAHSWNQIWTLK